MRPVYHLLVNYLRGRLIWNWLWIWTVGPAGLAGAGWCGAGVLGPAVALLSSLSLLSGFPGAGAGGLSIFFFLRTFYIKL